MPGTKGYKPLAMRPPGVPAQVARKNSIMHVSHLAELKSKMMAAVLKSQDLEQCISWNYEAAKKGGEVPMEPLEEVVPAGQWGRLHAIGAVPGKRGPLRLLEKITGGDTHSPLYDLPDGPLQEHLDAVSTAYHFSHDQPLKEGAPLPCIRYTTVKRQKSSMYKHPNNVRHRELTARQSENREQPHLADPADGEDQEDDSDDAPLAVASADADDAKAADAGAPLAAHGAPLAAASADADDAPAADADAFFYREGNKEFFEIDFTNCKPDVFYVAKAEFQDG